MGLHHSNRSGHLKTKVGTITEDERAVPAPTPRMTLGNRAVCLFCIASLSADTSNRNVQLLSCEVPVFLDFISGHLNP